MRLLVVAVVAEIVAGGIDVDARVAGSRLGGIEVEGCGELLELAIDKHVHLPGRRRHGAFGGVDLGLGGGGREKRCSGGRHEQPSGSKNMHGGSEMKIAFRYGMVGERARDT
ncbi:hypothetical protein PAMC26577_08550 [Caballeronia sordidicola]|uniref:Uncharacterized protein n=1 Tax=Caballeronia sordidicola TaxID=196367 RepID=A0A242N0B4_CABSO|nr:hypothetical protein PAMC26577_08550 [Caballeronia sordidicola]